MEGGSTRQDNSAPEQTPKQPKSTPLPPPKKRLVASSQNRQQRQTLRARACGQVPIISPMTFPPAQPTCHLPPSNIHLGKNMPAAAGLLARKHRRTRQYPIRTRQTKTELTHWPLLSSQKQNLERTEKKKGCPFSRIHGVSRHSSKRPR